MSYKVRAITGSMFLFPFTKLELRRGMVQNFSYLNSYQNSLQLTEEYLIGY